MRMPFSLSITKKHLPYMKLLWNFLYQRMINAFIEEVKEWLAKTGHKYSQPKESPDTGCVDNGIQPEGNISNILSVRASSAKSRITGATVCTSLNSTLGGSQRTLCIVVSIYLQIKPITEASVFSTLQMNIKLHLLTWKTSLRMFKCNRTIDIYINFVL